MFSNNHQIQLRCVYNVKVWSGFVFSKKLTSKHESIGWSVLKKTWPIQWRWWARIDFSLFLSLSHVFHSLRSSYEVSQTLALLSFSYNFVVCFQLTCWAEVFYNLAKAVSSFSTWKRRMANTCIDRKIESERKNVVCCFRKWVFTLRECFKTEEGKISAGVRNGGSKRERKKE